MAIAWIPFSIRRGSGLSDFMVAQRFIALRQSTGRLRQRNGSGGVRAGGGGGLAGPP